MGSRPGPWDDGQISLVTAHSRDGLDVRVSNLSTTVSPVESIDDRPSLSDPISIEPTVEQFRLKKTFPNPARSQAAVRFAVPEQQDVSLRLYDVLGRQVRTVQQGDVQRRQELQVDVSGLPSGTYFLRLTTDG